MENYLQIMIAMFEHLGHISKEDATKLSKTLRISTIPADYESASRLIKTLINDLDIKKTK